MNVQEVSDAFQDYGDHVKAVVIMDDGTTRDIIGVEARTADDGTAAAGLIIDDPH